MAGVYLLMERVCVKVVRGMLSSWGQLFQEASEFASEIGQERLINISHSADNGDGVIAIWYWSGDDTGWQGSEPGSWKSEQ